MIEMDSLFQRIFRLRIEGVQLPEMSQELEISRSLLEEITGADAFVALQKILVGALLGGVEYDPITSARAACAEVDPAQVRKDIARNEGANPGTRLKALEDLENRGYGKPVERIQGVGRLNQELRMREEQIDSGLEGIGLRGGEAEA